MGRSSNDCHHSALQFESLLVEVDLLEEVGERRSVGEGRKMVRG